MGSEFPSDKVADQLQKLIALSSGAETNSFMRAAEGVSRTPKYGLMANLTWDTNGELDVR